MWSYSEIVSKMKYNYATDYLTKKKKKYNTD